MYAIVLDRTYRFGEAAIRYFELSLKSQLNADEKIQALQDALICSVFASRGQQKNRLLMNLFKDERCLSLIGYPIIKVIYFSSVFYNYVSNIILKCNFLMLNQGCQQICIKK